ncbi:MAG: PQQ-dependent sugar dehydrogenase [Bdellovibrionales bacterium]|nr:PQQ-dependent sugar dehydrogenase [Bdellovibrionales bacterium]
MIVLFSSLLPIVTALAAPEPPITNLKVPQGYEVSIYAFPVPDARSLTLGPNGIVFVGTRNKHVYALVPAGSKAEVVTVSDDRRSPNGVAFKDGDLYVAEIDKILVYKNIAKNVKSPGKPVEWGPKFPDRTHHGWKFIAFGPDGWLYIPVGAPCNVCKEKPDTFANIQRVSADGRKKELVAQGVRNTVGFDWHPQTKQLWFTDNGRDWLGDDIPPDELNVVSKTKEHFGFPYCHGKAIKDSEFNENKDCAQFTPPNFEFPAHAASLGMRFLRHEKAQKDTAIVALHGSWNRSTPIGYEVVKLQMKDGKVAKSESFVSGFLQSNKAWGRPVDVLELADGSILVSDDAAGAVYKVSRK